MTIFSVIRWPCRWIKYHVPNKKSVWVRFLEKQTTQVHPHPNIPVSLHSLTKYKGRTPRKKGPNLSGSSYWLVTGYKTCFLHENSWTWAKLKYQIIYPAQFLLFSFYHHADLWEISDLKLLPRTFCLSMMVPPWGQNDIFYLFADLFVPSHSPKVKHFTYFK